MKFDRYVVNADRGALFLLVQAIYQSRTVSNRLVNGFGLFCLGHHKSHPFQRLPQV
ncbi:hypothetical protein [Exiguobacterium sp.]|uniref:hypothetical protein n=1 Tax=Exiguobacterium sp. TaxID=44751 RepID=UPI00307D50C0